MISPCHRVLLVHMPMRQGFMKSEMGVNRMTESVFSERVRALRGPMWRIAWAILRNGADCDDAIQEALLRAWNRIGSLRDETALDARLMRILVNGAQGHPAPSRTTSADTVGSLRGISRTRRKHRLARRDTRPVDVIAPAAAVALYGGL